MSRPPKRLLHNTGPGTVAADSSGGGNTGTYSGVTLSQGGPLAGDSDTAALFNGTSSAVKTVQR